MVSPLQSAQPARDEAGLAISRRYGDVYASRDGALAQARHVFLRGNGLPERWRGRRQFVILETGFGLGTNFLAAWHAWRADPERCERLHFVSTELHPLTAAEMREFAPPGCEDLREELLRKWPPALPGLHRIHLGQEGRVVLTLAFGDAQELLPALVLGADAMFLDGFAPDRNPDLWSGKIFSAIARLARPGATAATWSSARAVREGLAGAGFEVELRPGFGAKREMLAARFAPRWKMRRHEPASAYEGERSAIIVGAGLAGCSCALALARRGWRVRILDAGDRVAAAASALPSGLLHPRASADHNLASRLVQAGFLLARSQLQEAGDGADRVWRECGVFEQSADEEDAVRMRRWLERLGPPERHARWLDAAAVATRLGLEPRRGGLWYETGAIVSAAAWCATMLRRAGEGVRLELGVRVESIDPGMGRWQARCANGQAFGAARLVLANALDATRLAGAFQDVVRGVPGRISHIAPAPPGLRAGLCGDGYLLPPILAPAAVGATFEDPMARKEMRALDEQSAHQENLGRISRLVATPWDATPVGVFEGTRCLSQDRLPLAGWIVDDAALGADPGASRGAHLGDLPRREGLACAFALGSHGLALHALVAELVASQLEGEPWPVERPLAEAVDPGRFLLGSLRDSSSSGTTTDFLSLPGRGQA